jgi:hypothetical protein
VDSKSNWVKQTGLTPHKMALIVVLAVVLVGVLYHQLVGFSSKPPSVAAEPTAAPESSAVQTKSNDAHGPSNKANGFARTNTTIRGQWQSPSVATVVAYDPFALPASFPRALAQDDAGTLARSEASTREDASARRAALAAEREQTQSQLIGLRQQGVRVIIKRNDQYVAIVGDQEVHVGDQLDGFTVIAIDADNVYVAKDLSR